jgi:hypothetical protein
LKIIRSFVIFEEKFQSLSAVFTETLFIVNYF